MAGGRGARPDVVVIGAGAVGASTALHLAQMGLRVLVLEKEGGPARHQSGRNSGVIHAGYNLAPGSLKARYCVEGSRQLRAYCRETGVPMIQGGILVVARRDEEEAVLMELERRATANGVSARLVGPPEMAEIEPHATGVRALHAPEGASFDAAAYVRRLLADAEALGTRVAYGVRIHAVADHSLDGSRGSAVGLQTSHGPMEAAAIVNCAGLHADRMAGPLARDVRVIPFRGYYAALRPDRRHLVRSHVYSAPDLAFPFLGVHASRHPDGTVLIGPGAMLAFGREAYRFAGATLADLGALLTWPGFYRLFTHRRFRSLVTREVHKSLSLRAIWAEAVRLVPDLRPGDLTRSLAGNRAQLVRRDGGLVQDILVRETERAVHVLNAVSPGLTCSLPFGAYLAERCCSKL